MSASTMVELFSEVEGLIFRGEVLVSSIDREAMVEFSYSNRYLAFRIDHRSTAAIVDASSETIQAKISSAWGECLVKGPPTISKQTVH